MSNNCSQYSDYIDLNKKDEYGNALISAVKFNDIILVEKLLKKGIDINVQDENGDTALIWAVFKSNLPMVELLLKYNPDKILKNKEEITFEFKDKSNINNDKILELLGIKDLCKDVFDAFGKKDLSAFKQLIEEGANVNCKNDNNWTLLMMTSNNGMTDFVKYLLSFPNINVNAQNESGWTALMLSCYRSNTTSNIEVVKLLLNHPDINLNIINKNGDTVLLASIDAYYDKILKIEVIKLLLEQPKLNINIQDINGNSALMYAVKNNMLDVVKLLLERKDIDLSLKNKNGYTTKDLATSDEMKKLLFPETSCNIITENGDKCVNHTEYVKDGININCKGYCKDHYNKIILDLKKDYPTVVINEVEYKTQSITTTLNNKDIKKLSDTQLIKLFNTEDKINVKIVVDVGDKLPIGNVDGWGKEKVKWISSNGWKINKNKVIIDYNISYIGEKFTRQPKDDILCKNVNYKTQQKLGEGSYGKVYLINENLIVKSMEYVDEDGYDLIENNIKELCFLTQYRYGFMIDLKCIELPRENEFKAHIKNAGMSLDKVIHTKLYDKMMEDINYVVYQIILAFKTFEEHDIIHGDLKPANIGIDDNLKITILDWGSVSLNTKTKDNLKKGTVIFRPSYETGKIMFREKIYTDEPISLKNDIYSIGLCIIYLFQKSYSEMYSRSANKNFKINLNDIIDVELKEIVDNMISVDYDKRLLASELYNKPIFDKYKPPRYSEINNFKMKVKEIDYINPDYMSNRIDITLKMRTILIGWIHEVYKQFKYLNSFILSCYLIDLYLTKEVLESKKLQLLCMGCMYIAILMINHHNLRAEDLVKLTAKAYDFKDFKTIILKILTALNFIVYKKTFDTQIKDIDYEKIKILMLNNDLIGVSDDVYLQKYKEL